MFAVPPLLLTKIPPDVLCTSWVGWVAREQVDGLVGLSQWLFGLAADASLGIVACALLLRHTGAAARAAHQALHLLHVDVRHTERERERDTKERRGAGSRELHAENSTPKTR